MQVYGRGAILSKIGKGPNGDSKSTPFLVYLSLSSLTSQQIGDVNKIRELVKEGLLVNDSNYHYGLTPLNMAAAHGHLEAIRELVKAGACIFMNKREDRTSRE